MPLSSEKLFTLTSKFEANETNQVFGLTNTLLTAVNDWQTPILHFWTLPNTLILGIKDRHLPFLPAALEQVHQHGYQTMLRNSGGLAVVADANVLNVSLFVPGNDGKPIPVEDAYQLMYQLVSRVYPTLFLDHVEITQSYCPGDYDISMNGIKIAGMAQRRSKGATVIMLYLSVSGNQDARGELVRNFYKTGLNDEPNPLNFPDVDPHVMTTAEKLLGHDQNLDDTITAFLAQAAVNHQLESGQLQTLMAQPTFQAQLAVEVDKMVKRQPKLSH